MLRLVKDDETNMTLSQNNEAIPELPKPRKHKTLRKHNPTVEAQLPTPTETEVSPPILAPEEEAVDDIAPDISTEGIKRRARKRKKPADVEPAELSPEGASENIVPDESVVPAEIPGTAAAMDEEADGMVVLDENEQKCANPAGLDAHVLEALLFSTHHPLTAGRLAELMDLTGTKPVRQAIVALNQRYQELGHCFRIEQVAGGYQFLTLPEYAEYLKKLHQKEIDTKLTKAALETLAIIAYKQPALRVDIEAIRGVACGETIRSLMEKHLVRIAGRAEEPGRPILYGTTRRFLELFGLNNLEDLPKTEK